MSVVSTRSVEATTVRWTERWTGLGNNWFPETIGAITITHLTNPMVQEV